MALRAQLRRTSASILIPLATLGLAALALPGAATATPAITSFKATILPIPGFRGTGDKLGAGAIVQATATISGTEYWGSPPPATGLKVFAPAGMKLHRHGFATCAASLLERVGPQRCPRRSIAGPKGSVSGVVSFGGERVGETASVQAFFAPGGGIEAFVDGATPVSFEIIANDHIVRAARPFGHELVGEVPLIETVPGAPYASFVSGRISAGAAYRRGGRMVSYIRLPKTCARGGWPMKVEVEFLGGATAQAAYKTPCPKR